MSEWIPGIGDVVKDKTDNNVYVLRKGEGKYLWCDHSKKSDLRITLGWSGTKDFIRTRFDFVRHSRYAIRSLDTGLWYGRPYASQREDKTWGCFHRNHTPKAERTIHLSRGVAHAIAKSLRENHGHSCRVVRVK